MKLSTAKCAAVTYEVINSKTSHSHLWSYQQQNEPQSLMKLSTAKWATVTREVFNSKMASKLCQRFKDAVPILEDFKVEGQHKIFFFFFLKQLLCNFVLNNDAGGGGKGEGVSVGRTHAGLLFSFSFFKGMGWMVGLGGGGGGWGWRKQLIWCMQYLLLGDLLCLNGRGWGSSPLPIVLHIISIAFFFM